MHSSILHTYVYISRNHVYIPIVPAFSVQKTLRERTFGMSFWKKKSKERLKAHGKEFAAQEALLQKLVAAPGEYKRRDGFDLDDLLAEEDKKADKEYAKGNDEGEEDEIGTVDEESSIFTGEEKHGTENQDEKSEDSGDNMTEDQVAHLLNIDA